MTEITREQIRAWNRMSKALEGTPNYALFSLTHEYLNGTRWILLRNSRDIRGQMVEHPSDRFYIKTIKGLTYIYWEDCSGSKERWWLSDLAKAYFIGEE